jgi:hypothetical protein
MTRAVFAGHDAHDLVDALDAAGVEVTTIDDIATRPALEDAGIHDADLFVLTDVGQATAIPIAREQNPEVRIVVYTDESLPEFVSAQQVLSVDPELLDPETVVEELVD